ncbi:probable deubiquitinase OTUD6B at N-terminal half [Coccomyxa sp. Obi]|nr:probable deubiquitinase OTUD6B at N-terminal half [Coccomyxa sp. Obi]
MALRQKVVNFIKQHGEDFEPFMEDGETLANYCRRMSEDGTWAGYQEQVAVARLCSVAIRIYQAGQPVWTIKPDYPDFPKDAAAIHLSYHDGEHYNSVRRADDHTNGPALPIIIAERTPTSAEKAAARSWGPSEEEQVVRGTGCFDDPSAVRQALEDAHGDPDQAIEILIERLASEAVPSSKDPGVEKGAVASISCSGGAAAGEELAQSEGRRLADSADTCTGPEDLACRGTNGSQLGTSGEAETQVLENGADTVDSQRSLHNAHEGTDKPDSVSDGTGLRRNKSELSDVTRSLEELQCCSMNPAENAHSRRETPYSSAAGTPDADSVDGGSQYKQEPQISKQKQMGGLRIAVGKKPPRNRECPCGSKKRYKNCCGPADAAAARRLASGIVQEPVAQALAAIYV